MRGRRHISDAWASEVVRRREGRKGEHERDCHVLVKDYMLVRHDMGWIDCASIQISIPPFRLRCKYSLVLHHHTTLAIMHILNDVPPYEVSENGF